MSTADLPDPILDSRERTRFSKLKDEYEDFRSPGFLGRQANRAKRGLSSAHDSLTKWVPGLDTAEKGIRDLLIEASEKEIVEEALSTAAKGGGAAFRWCAQSTLSKDAVRRRLDGEEDIGAGEFERICTNRSYRLEPLAEKDWKSRCGVALQGLVTGAIGGARGLLLNLALSTALFLRATQRVALHFGYDAVGRDHEQIIASEITLEALQPGGSAASGSTGGILGKMMNAAEVSGLKKGLQHRTYQEMAKQGGSQLLYTKLRATANKAAEKALDKAGKEGFETALVQRLLRDLGERMSKQAGQRAVPLIGGLFAGSIDTFQMQQVIRGAVLHYHKRFIAEKEERVRQLRSQLSHR
jgi:hypothetical protein